MGKIETIKQNILQLDGGEFQALCDCYLSKSGYPNIVSLGSQAGTHKTTRGTPDTYFTTTDGKYIFVEYTTQTSGLPDKILTDLKKCIDPPPAKITHDMIAEIIYCHTSSNITPSQDQEFKDYCNKVGIKLTLIGIDKLAQDIYLSHHELARDFLNISLSTGQIQSVADFVKQYNANPLAAPLDTTFLFREKEIAELNNAYQVADVVILHGSAGTGKTRLALHYAQTHAAQYNETLYCIHNNGLAIYEDLKIALHKPGYYFLFIDDANLLSNLDLILQYTHKKEDNYHIKILITARDYAYEKVSQCTKNTVLHRSISLGIFSDDEIIEILKKLFNILNQDYHRRITTIAEGNARLAVLAAKLACSEKGLSAISDASTLYEDYYASFLQQSNLFQDRNTYITTGIISFVGSLHLEYLDNLSAILQANGLSVLDFIESTKALHDCEIVNIYHDKAVRFSEQCLSNYLLKHIFFDKRLISLSQMIELSFEKHREKTIYAINTLLSIFQNSELNEFIINEVKIAWCNLEKKNSPYFFDFVSVFFSLNPTPALIILQKKIEQEKSVSIDYSNIDTERNKNYQHVTNNIIDILSKFAVLDDFSTALDLFFQYYLKRPDLYIEFYHAINTHFSITNYSDRNNYATQILFLKKVKEYSNSWSNEFILLLFFDIIPQFLKFTFSPMEAARKHTFTIYTIRLTKSVGVETYRKSIWQALLTLCKNKQHNESFKKALSSYGDSIDKASRSILEFDLPYIAAILNKAFSVDNLTDCIWVYNLSRSFTRMDISCGNTFSKYFDTEHFKLYKLLQGPHYTKNIDWSELDTMKRDAIHQYVATCTLDDFKSLINICSEIHNLDGHTIWQAKEGFGIAFNQFLLNPEHCFDAIEYYLEKDTPFHIAPTNLLSHLFTSAPESDVFQLINRIEFKEKNGWLYAYYATLPTEAITTAHSSAVLDFLTNTLDQTNGHVSYRDIRFLKRYNTSDTDIFTTGCINVLKQAKHSPIIAQSYFSFLFYSPDITPQNLIAEFSDNLSLLEDIYVTMLSADSHNDYDGKFLKELYLATPSILEKYISYLTPTQSNFHDPEEKHLCFFDTPNFIEIYNKIFNTIISETPYAEYVVPSFLKSILLPTKNKIQLLDKQDQFIRQYIDQYNADESKMACLFLVISELSNERQQRYILLFIKKNHSFDAFKKIPLEPHVSICSDSFITQYSTRIEFIESLLPHLTGLTFLNHKDYLEAIISDLRHDIEREEIQKILRD